MQALMPEIYRWIWPAETITTAPVKHGTGLLISLIVSLLMVACSVTIWYLSATAEFSRKPSPPPPAASKPKSIVPPKPKPGTPAQPKPNPNTTAQPKAKPATPPL